MPKPTQGGTGFSLILNIYAFKVWIPMLEGPRIHKPYLLPSFSGGCVRGQRATKMNIFAYTLKQREIEKLNFHPAHIWSKPKRLLRKFDETSNSIFWSVFSFLRHWEGKRRGREVMVANQYSYPTIAIPTRLLTCFLLDIVSHQTGPVNSVSYLKMYIYLHIISS